MITKTELLNLISQHNFYNMDLKINGEFYKTSNIKAIENAFKNNYQDTINLKINGEIKVLNGEIIN